MKTLPKEWIIVSTVETNKTGSERNLLLEQQQVQYL